MTKNGSNFVPKLHNFQRASKIRPIEAFSELMIESTVNIRQQKIDTNWFVGLKNMY